MYKKVSIALLSLTILSGCQFSGTTAESNKDTSHSKEIAKDTATKTKKQEDPLPNVSSNDWNLILVNNDHPMEAIETPLKVLPNGLQIDERMETDYNAWMNAAKEAGFNMVLVSSYRSYDLQKQVYNQSISDNQSQGMSYDDAVAETKKYVAFPGSSEHQTALAIDIVDDEWLATGKGLIPEYDQTASQKWLVQTMKDYGFILRFPKHKEDLTKISYESWHFRYVGKENAAYIIDHDLSLEEYITKLQEAGK